MKKKLRSYQEKLLKDLRDPELAYHYLNEAWADNDHRITLLALKNVYKAQCPKNHIPNKTTKKALENLKLRKSLQKADTLEELFEKLDQ